MKFGCMWEVEVVEQVAVAAAAESQRLAVAAGRATSLAADMVNVVEAVQLESWPMGWAAVLSLKKLVSLYKPRDCVAAD